MEINGITFEDWAAAAANIAHGMSGEEVCQILGIEMPVWEDTNMQWGEKMADLMTNDMSVAQKYGEIFANPKVGKFANEGNTGSIEGVLAKVPDYDTFMRITMHVSKAAEVGLDPGAIYGEYDLNLQEWGQVGMHYNKWVKDRFIEGDNATPEEQEMFQNANNKWEQFYDEHYKDQGVDLGDDIDF